jgi:hypothetical protein
MSDPSNNYGNAEAVEKTLIEKSMPPFWSAEQLSLYKQWRNDGYQP